MNAPRLFLLSFLLSFSFMVFAQEQVPENVSEELEQEPIRTWVVQDQKVDTLVKDFREMNKRRGMAGFRVQIYTASGNRSRLLTERQKAEFDASFPNVPSYITYDEPYFKLRVGDFRTRLDAQRFSRQISSKYIFATVVVDRINPPQLKTEGSSLIPERSHRGEE